MSEEKHEFQVIKALSRYQYHMSFPLNGSAQSTAILTSADGSLSTNNKVVGFRKYIFS